MLIHGQQHQHFFRSHQTLFEPPQPNCARAQHHLFVLTEAQCFLLPNSH